jgi:hypothetical protein
MFRLLTILVLDLYPNITETILSYTQYVIHHCH